jgi:hypothetical protein
MTEARCDSGRRDISAMSRPAKVTESDSALRRLPWQTGQSLGTMYCATRLRIAALWLVAKVCIT